jgi:hypothetical protein
MGENKNEDSNFDKLTLENQIDADYFLISDSKSRALCAVEKSKMIFHTTSKSPTIKGHFNYDDAYWVYKPGEILLTQLETEKYSKIAKKCEQNHNKYMQTQIDTLREKTIFSKLSFLNV